MKEKVFAIFKLKTVRTIFSCVIFLILAVHLFLGITYVFRNANNDRARIAGIKNVSDIDVVYLGGSAAYAYWEAPAAWKEYGITSYVYATSKLQAETIKGELREILKYQNPKLIVIDARPFQYWEKDVITEPGIRNVADSMDYSLNRFLTVADGFRYREPQEKPDYASYFLDIAKYHTNDTNLLNESCWKLYRNKTACLYNGWEFEHEKKHEFLSMPEAAASDKPEPLEEGSEKILRDLLEYCTKKKLTVLFAVSPYYISESDRMQFRYMQNIVEEYGYRFLDANDYYDEMQLDFEKDYYNINHVNLFGAEKYTRFLANYIKSNYAVEDHRGDAVFADWDTVYEDFAKEEAALKSEIETIISQKDTSYENGKKLKNIKNPDEWLGSIKDENYYILLESKGDNWTDTNAVCEVLDALNIPNLISLGLIRVCAGTEVVYESNDMKEETYAEEFTGHSDRIVKYEINSGDKSTITIDGTEYSPKADGLNIVVYDKNYREVLDSVALVQDESGEIRLIR